LHTILKTIELPLALPIHATNSTACQTEAHHEANHAQKWNPESSSPGQSRRPRPLGIRAPVAGAGAGAAGVLEPTLLLHRWHEATEQICTESSEIRVRFRPSTVRRARMTSWEGWGERLLTWFGRLNRRRAEVKPRSRTDKGKGSDRPRTQFDVVGGMNLYTVLYYYQHFAPGHRLVHRKSVTDIGPNAGIGVLVPPDVYGTRAGRRRHGAKRKPEAAHCGPRSDSDVAIGLGDVASAHANIPRAGERGRGRSTNGVIF
jgi:hypothetical protein